MLNAAQAVGPSVPPSLNHQLQVLQWDGKTKLWMWPMAHVSLQHQWGFPPTDSDLVSASAPTVFTHPTQGSMGKQGRGSSAAIAHSILPESKSPGATTDGRTFTATSASTQVLSQPFRLCRFLLTASTD